MPARYQTATRGEHEMSLFNNLKVGTRLTLAFGIVVLLTGAIAAVAVNRLALVNETTREIAEERWPATVLANEVVDLANANGRAALQLLVLTDWAAIDVARDAITAASTAIDEILPRLEAAMETAEGRDLFARLQQAREPYVLSVQRVASLVESEERAAALAVATDQMIPRLDTYIQAIDDLIDYQGAHVVRAGVAAGDAYRGARAVLLLSALIAVLLAIVLGFIITRSIKQPLERAVWLMAEIGSGHLSKRAEVDQKDELGELVGVMNQFASDLKVHVFGVLDRLSRGDLAVEVLKKDDEDEISPVLQRVRDSLQALVDESSSLTDAALAGRLSERADAGRLQGGYREVIEGINATLDAINAPIQEASTVLARVADRDLSIRMTGAYKGDYGVIKTSLNTALDNLEGALAEVAVAAGQVSTAADQISGGSQNLAEGASEQASSLEEVSSSLQELASMSNQNTGNAREARGLVEAAGGSTETGAAAMQRLSATVQRIKESSDATGRIVKTIDEIAFQTNLLALNAAVEAARAGEAGKGFAVVAEEVRNLAMRSAEAAKETSRLIEESVSSSEEGVLVQAEVVKQLDEIRTGVVRVREVMGEIAAASEQQTEGVGQINEAVEEMNAVTQRSAASSEESASAAEELSGQAQRMAELVGQFTLTGARAPVRPAAPPREAEVSAKPSRPARRAAPAGNGHGKPAPKPKAGNGSSRISPAELIPLDDDDSDALLREF
jgi:methyl-accepting chemotaxis protein